MSDSAAVARAMQNWPSLNFPGTGQRPVSGKTST